jgi:hypothetical protein
MMLISTGTFAAGAWFTVTVTVNSWSLLTRFVAEGGSIEQLGVWDGVGDGVGVRVGERVCVDVADGVGLRVGEADAGEVTDGVAVGSGGPTWTHAENSDVLLSGSVAVAVMLPCAVSAVDSA